ncbi:unnamed protein product [Phytophthora lilii]|uniref:Unnamed protein product n=1 Tax=Phytophthora lilii TaxID=2077276 RepID=A0A9W6TID2_9STRA|nr:unnamed protein product [Phytophthora lilii]
MAVCSLEYNAQTVCPRIGKKASSKDGNSAIDADYGCHRSCTHDFGGHTAQDIFVVPCLRQHWLALYYLVEIALRAVKTRHVQHQLRRISVFCVVTVKNPGRKSSSRKKRTKLGLVRSASSLTPLSTRSEDLTTQKLLSLHAAEVYADMCAEYIAMGSSTAATVAFMNDGYFATIALQLGIDLVATSLEISRGVDFDAFNRDDVFLVLFMVGIATLNVHISSGVYLKAT